MEITIQLPLPHSTARKAAAIQAIDSHTNRTIQANIVAPPDYDHERVDVRGTVKGVGARTWEKWTVAVKMAIKDVL